MLRCLLLAGLVASWPLSGTARGDNALAAIADGPKKEAKAKEAREKKSEIQTIRARLKRDAARRSG